DHWMNHERKLVEQTISKQGSNQRGASTYPDILSRQILELGNLLGNVFFHQEGLLPFTPVNLIQGLGNHVLGNVVYVACIWFVRRGWPIRFPLLICDAPKKHSVLHIRLRC